jgi:dienelactone hydrolase
MQTAQRLAITLCACLLSALLAPRVSAADAAATRPANLDNGWDSRIFRYERAKSLPVEESTPTPQQVDFRDRPPVGAAAAAAPVTTQATPCSVGPVNILRLRFRDAQGDDVPVLLCKPSGKPGPFPLVIAIHGVCSNKAQACGIFMHGLASHGFAILAPDLPLHGERPGDPAELTRAPDLVKVAELARQAIIDLRQCIDVADARADLDTRHGVILAGYSLGALLGSIAGPADDRVKAMLLMAGGTPDLPAAYSAIPIFRALQPQLAIPHFAGRPLLMLNGTLDTAITRDMGERLFAAASEPKRQTWYETGHELPQQATEDGTAWIAKTWMAIVDAK